MKSIDRYKGPWETRHQRGGGEVLDETLSEDYRIRMGDIESFNSLVFEYFFKEDLKKYEESSRPPCIPPKL